MKKKLNYKIDNKLFPIEIDEKQIYKSGDNIILSNKENDITFDQEWYLDGYKSIKFLSDNDFLILKNEITKVISNLIFNTINVDVDGFTLDKYHKYIKTNEDHFEIVTKTRDLFSSDFEFDVENLISKLSDLFGFELTDFDSYSKTKVHIIIRINRPNSNDYNPPHKDIYEGYDNDGYCPKFVNFWIPIDGVNSDTSLPIVPKSHLIPENKIYRTTSGGVIGENKYRVRFVKDWGNNKLIRSDVKYGEVLVFSPHLIHGLAVNNEKDITRVALEFRLFKK